MKIVLLYNFDDKMTESDTDNYYSEAEYELGFILLLIDKQSM